MKVLEKVAQKSYDQIRKEHIAAHQELYRRVDIDLGSNDASSKPTDERFKNFAEGGSDPQLAALYFQFGRYLLISSFCPGTKPANLQGIWNEEMNPSWDSKYTTNINLDMNYRPVEVVNLADVLKGSTLFFVDTLVEHPKYKVLVTCPATSPENVPHRPGNKSIHDEIIGGK